MSDDSQSHPSRPLPHPVILPLTVASGVFMEGLDSTIIATSLPQMARSLEVSATYLSLAITSYLLSLAIVSPISGWMADRFGARRMYCIAIATFACSSGLCAWAPNLAFMVLMRIIQGASAALMTPVARLILVRSFPKSLYLKATNYMVIPGLLGPMAGPVVGGFITAYFSWHWIFLINIPIGVISIALALWLVDELPVQRPPPFDFPGFAIVSVGFATMQFWLEYLGRHIIGLWMQITLFVAATATLLVYGRYARTQPEPVLDLKIFRLPTFSISVLWGSLARIGIGGIPFLLPLLFQLGFGLDPFHAGVLMFVSTSGALFMRVGFSKVLERWGLRNVLLVDTVILAFMLPGFMLFHASTSHWILVPYLFTFGFMRTILFLCLNMLSYADMTPENMSKGTSIFTVGQRLSMSAGVALSAFLLSVSTGGSAQITEPHFHLVFTVLGIAEIVSLWGFWRLHPKAGQEITSGQ